MIAVLLLLGCGGGTESAPDVVTGGELVDTARGEAEVPVVAVPERIDGFRSDAASAGFAVQDGRFEFLDYGRCCLPGASCLWNNPSTPYGLYALPPCARTDGR